MPNFMITTTAILAKTCVPIVLTRSLHHVVLRSTCHSKKINAPRVSFNYTLLQSFHINIDFDKHETKRNSDEKQLSVTHSKETNYKDSKKVILARKSEKDPFEPVLSDEEIDKYFPDSDLKKQFKLIALEVDVLRQNGLCVPQQLTIEDVYKLLTAPSKGYKMKTIRYLFLNEIKRNAVMKRKDRAKEDYINSLEKLNTESTSGIKYGISHNTLFLRLYPKTIHHSSAKRLIQAQLFEKPLIFDCGYEQYMTRIEIENCARQIIISYSVNRDNVEPINLQLCNLKRDSFLSKKLLKTLPQLYDDDFPTPVYEESYLDLHKKEDLVYLTPHCRKPLMKYDPNKIYIVGAFVDKAQPQDVSSAKAKREGIAMARLPLDEYIQWAPGSGKSLAINIMTMIMLTIKNTKNWELALQHVPRRKVQREEQTELCDNDTKEKQHHFRFNVYKRN